MSTVVSGNGNNQTEETLSDFPALAGHLLLVILSFPARTIVSNLTRWSFSPFIFLYPILSYLVSPLLLFVAMIANLSFIIPFNTTHYIITSLYPVYLFCGVACIAGVAIGIGGRSVSTFLTKSFEKAEGDESGSTHVPAIRGDERRSGRRRRRVRE